MVATLDAVPNQPLCGLKLEFLVSRARTGEKVKCLTDLLELNARGNHEQELFSAGDWEVIRWLGETYPANPPAAGPLLLFGTELLSWMARWGKRPRIVMKHGGAPLAFSGQVAEFL